MIKLAQAPPIKLWFWGVYIRLRNYAVLVILE